MIDSIVLCFFDGLPCNRVVDGHGFGACYVKGLDGKLRSVCARFKAGSSVPFVEDLVRKKLIPK